MFSGTEKPVGDGVSQERRDGQQTTRRILGHVVKCDGARATIAATIAMNDGEAADEWTVGRMISINLGDIRTVALVYEISRASGTWNEDGENQIEVGVELIGEVRDGAPGTRPTFDRGVSRYPYLGSIAHKIRARDLQSVYDLAGRQTVTIGHLSQDDTIDANIAIKDALTKHFAFVGSTGVGKSTAVSLLIRKSVEARPDLRVLIMDPHNEFAFSFGDACHRVDTDTLDLPFWMFRLEEFAEVLFRGRDIEPEEVEILRDLIPVAKQMYRQANAVGVARRGGAALTADTPVPYRMADVLKLLEDRMGALDNKSERPICRQLKYRIQAATNDPRYRFMFNSKLIEDTIHETIGEIFRVPDDGKRITCFEMAGLGAEIVNAVVSVLARLAFDLAVWSETKLKTLVVAEEAHRYLPADRELGFAPTRHALSRIAKEGRKYGCYLGIITQRPGELDPTILSQCSTVFAMRLANETDQSIIRSAIADSSASSLSFLSSMGQRECIAFGEGVATTMRLKFQKVPSNLLPGHHEDPATFGKDVEIDLETIVRRLRNANDDGSAEEAAEQEALLRQEQAKESLLRRRTTPRLDPEDDANFGYGLKSSTFGYRGS